MPKKRKILYVSGGRVDYGLMRQTLLAIRKHPKLSIEVAVTAMHLMPEFGRTIKQVEKDQFKIHQIKTIYQKDNKESMADFISQFVADFSKLLYKVKPDIILLLGDRAEELAGAITASYLNIPIAHVHGGDVSSTNDEPARHAITKLSHIHFPATQKSAQRILQMGEEKWRVKVSGAPGLDDIFYTKLLTKKQLAKKLGFGPDQPILLVLQHPVSLQIEKAGEQMKQTMEAIKQLGLQTVIIYPNADPGARKIIREIEKYRNLPFIKIYKTLERKEYLSLMKHSDVMLGNSSSGIIESASFKLPVVNIGPRQRNRQRANNVIDVGYNKKEIVQAIAKVMSKQFKARLKNCQNPYGNGQASIKIANTLSKITINKKLLDKKMTL